MFTNVTKKNKMRDIELLFTEGIGGIKLDREKDKNVIGVSS